ncbi:RNI-like protein [Macrolepiota fuliginosa MF-IS2]|uniref:RNI-like protein n=1 Tax=Macrolepiota fuliginosa MF-IS2 TaxID=1400762 RepID=A0A9P5XLG5_9AGAR|nr:RNI-like protein [Macrolepiota fuliginosa MF-IS2]
MFDDVESESASFHEDMIKIMDRLPTPDEYRRVRHLILQNPQSLQISSDELAEVLQACPHIETAILSGVPKLSDEAVVALAEAAINLQELDLAGCSEVTDVALLEVTNKFLPLQSIRLNGAVAITDSTISAIAKTCPRLVELDLGDLPLLTPLALRDLWSFSRKLRTLRLANCSSLTDKAFPSAIFDDDSVLSRMGNEKPLPHRPNTWLEVLPPLFLRHKAENLRVLDLTACNITDDAIDGIVSHAPRIQTFILTACFRLTDRALGSISQLRDHLDVVILAHVSNITDRGLVNLTRQCANLRCVDVSFCRNLTDMSVHELAGLSSLRRLSLVRVQKLTDIAIYALAEHATSLERLHLSYCDRLSLEAIHVMMKRLEKLHHLTAIGVPSLKRGGIQRFSELPPSSFDLSQRSAYKVFTGQNIVMLRRFLDKEERRRRDAEAQNIPFVERSDDKLDLH